MKCAVSFSLILVLLVLSLVPTVAFAQSDCQAWGDLAYSIFDRYNGIRQGRDIQTVAQMQALRREVEAFDISTCPAGEELYDTLIGLLNLSADSVVAVMVNDTALAGELTFQSTDFYFKATELVAAGPPTIAGTITSPKDGDTVLSHEVTVEGSYDPALLGDDELWVFVKTPQQHYYPQIVDGCDKERRTSVSLNSQRKTWSIPGFLGTADLGKGDTFEIILFSGGEAASDSVFGYFDSACAAGDYPGLVASDVYDSGAFTELHFIKVTRSP
jgi:hypothetical protein